MFAWLLRHVLLRGLPVETIDACLLHPEVLALLRFRFAYLFAFHAPVLVPLLELLGGQPGQPGDPSLPVLSLGLASLTMVLSDVPTGLYADRHGAKAALAKGLKATNVIMLGFFALGIVRAVWPAQAVQIGPWGVLLLEAAIGVSLALLSGADTVLFLQVARRSQIPGLLHRSFEGVGSSIRYLGTMVAVLVGSVLYDLTAWLCSSDSIKLVLQSGLFGLTVLAELWALHELRKIHDEHAPLHRPGLSELLRGFAEVLRFPRFFAEMWLLSMAAAVALFAVYLVQSPLSRLLTAQALANPWYWPLYTLLAVLGYFACSVGSQHYARHREEGLHTLPQRSVGLWLGSWLLLGLLPLVRWLLGGGPWHKMALIGGCAVLCVLYNYIRGFIEPYSAATLVRFTQEAGRTVPVSVVSGFNSLKRGAHFAYSAVFFWLQRRSLHGDPDTRLAQSLSYLAVGFLLLCLPALLGLRRVKPQVAPTL